MLLTYHDLIKKIANYDRCHAGPEMEAAYDEVIKFYPGARKIQYPCGEKIFHWELPPYWSCEVAELIDPNGKLIASKKQSNLSVFSYSPSFSGKIDLEDLRSHLFTNPKKPKSIPFHFRNQYRHRNPEWGFCLPHEIYENLIPGEYTVNIQSNLDYNGKMTQVDFLKEGKSKKEIIFVGHFDHPDQINDGLSGCIAAFEVINRLKNRETKYSYRAFASVEIVGSVAYLNKEPGFAENIKAGTFLALCGINEQLIYQTSFYHQNILDRAYANVINTRGNKEVIFSHREKIGNDENVFDSVGYEIPMGTFLRWPFENYHTSDDNFQNYSKEAIEELIERTLQVVDILENDCIPVANFKGIPSLASPEIDLYLSPTNISQTRNTTAIEKFGDKLSKEDCEYIQGETDLLYHFMRITLRMIDGKNSVLDICEETKMPFGFAFWYIKQLETKGLVSLKEVEHL